MQKPRRIGPLSNMLRCLDILEWDMRDPITLLDHNGDDLNLTKGSPELLREKFQEATTALHHNEVIKRIARNNLGNQKGFNGFCEQEPPLEDKAGNRASSCRKLHVCRNANPEWGSDPEQMPVLQSIC